MRSISLPRGWVWASTFIPTVVQGMSDGRLTRLNGNERANLATNRIAHLLYQEMGFGSGVKVRVLDCDGDLLKLLWKMGRFPERLNPVLSIPPLRVSSVPSLRGNPDERHHINKLLQDGLDKLLDKLLQDRLSADLSDRYFIAHQLAHFENLSGLKQGIAATALQLLGCGLFYGSRATKVMGVAVGLLGSLTSMGLNGLVSGYLEREADKRVISLLGADGSQIGLRIMQAFQHHRDAALSRSGGWRWRLYEVARGDLDRRWAIYRKGCDDFIRQEAFSPSNLRHQER